MVIQVWGRDVPAQICVIDNNKDDDIMVLSFGGFFVDLLM